VTAAENEDYLKSELIRLKTASWMLENFKKLASKHKVKICAGNFLCSFVQGAGNEFCV